MTQNVDVLFGKLDTYTDPALLPRGGLTRAENYVAVGPANYEKRQGQQLVTTITTTGIVDGAARLFVSGNELCLTDRTGRVMAQNDMATTATAARAFQLTGYNGHAAVERFPVYRNSATLGGARDVAQLQYTVSGVLRSVYAVVWIDGTVLKLAVYQEDTGAQIFFNASVAASAANCKVIGIGNAFFVGYHVPGGTNLLWYSFDPTTAATTTGTISAAQVDATSWDWFNISTSLVAVWYYATGNQLKLATFTGAGAATTRQSPVEFTTPAAMAVTVGGGAIACLAWEAVNTLRLWVFNDTTYAAISGPTIIDATAAPVTQAIGACVAPSSGNIHVVYQRNFGAADSYSVFHQELTQAGAIVGAIRRYSGLWLVGKPFADLLPTYTINCLVYYPSYSHLTGLTGIQTTFFLLNIDRNTAAKPRPVTARAAFQIAFSQVAPDPMISAVASVAPVVTGQYVHTYVGAIILKNPTATTNQLTGIDLIKFTIGAPTLSQASTLGKGQMLASGAPAFYDGRSAVEHNFHVFPEAPLCVAGGAGSMGAGTYLYKVTFEHLNANGDTAYSSTSLPTSVVVGAAGSVALSICPYWLGTQNVALVQDPIRAVIYRTLAGGTQYFKVKEVANNDTVQVLTYTDTMADATLAVQPQLYTNGGTLNNEPPAASLCSVSTSLGFFYVPSEDRTVVRFSPFYTPGTQPWFSQALGIRVGQAGDLVALGVMDDKVFAFKLTSLYYISGDVPNGTGGGGSLSGAVQIASDCGAMEALSVVTTPIGIMFRSLKGIQLVDRGLSLKFIGSPVDYWHSNYRYCTSAVLMADRREVRFAMTGSTGAFSDPESVTLVYNYDFDAWTVFVFDGGAADSVTAVLGPSGYTWTTATTSDVPRVETASATTDAAGTVVTGLIETGWNNGGSLQGLARLRRMLFLGERLARHGMKLEIAFDYSSPADYTTQTPATFTWATLQNLNEMVSLQPLHQKSPAYRFRITELVDGTPTTTKTHNARGLTLELRVKPGSAARVAQQISKG